MRLTSVLILTLVAGGLFSSGAIAEDVAAKSVEVKGSYIRATIPGQANSSAYFKLKNNSEKDHALVNVTSPVADQVQIHVSIEEKGVAKMRRVSEVALGSHKQAALEPGGMHVMLLGLKKGIQLGETIPLTLAFEDGSSQIVDFPVRGLIGENPSDSKVQHDHG